MEKWCIKVNESKCQHITFTTRKHTCPPVALNNLLIAQTSEVKLILWQALKLEETYLY